MKRLETVSAIALAKVGLEKYGIEAAVIARFLSQEFGAQEIEPQKGEGIRLWLHQMALPTGETIRNVVVRVDDDFTRVQAQDSEIASTALRTILTRIDENLPNRASGLQDEVVHYDSRIKVLWDFPLLSLLIPELPATLQRNTEWFSFVEKERPALICSAIHLQILPDIKTLTGSEVLETGLPTSRFDIEVQSIADSLGNIVTLAGGLRDDQLELAARTLEEAFIDRQTKE